jgi:hypothetical protein
LRSVMGEIHRMAISWPLQIAEAHMDRPDDADWGDSSSGLI